MIKLLLVVAVQIAVISAGLPTIYQPLQEDVQKDRVTLAWSVRGDTSDNYQFLVNVKEYENSLNPNIKGIEREVNKAYTRTTISDLKSGTTYAATIKAVDLDGQDAGGSSTNVIFTTKGIKPPRSLKITEITDSSVIFEWSPPIGVEIDATRIRLINNKNKQVLTYPDQPSTLTEYEVTGLSPGIPYIIQIQSVKGKSLSTITKNGLRTAVGTIDRVRMSDVSPTGATTHWDQPQSEKDHKINRYEIGLIKDASNKETETKTEVVSTPSNRPDILKHTFGTLIPGRYYGIKVRVVYQVNGFGPWSKIIFFETKTQTAPSAPTKLSVVRAEKTTAQLRWEAPTNFKQIIEYEIQYAKLRSRPLPVVQTQGSSTEYVITNLESGTEYTAKVRAIGQHNIIGQWSVENAIKTSGPKPVSSVTLTEITDASVRVTWTTYSDVKPTKIRIYHRITDSPSWNIQTVEGTMVAVSLSGLSPTTPYQIKVTILDKDNKESSDVISGLRTNINLDIISQKPTNLDLRMKSPTQLSVTFHKVSNRLVKFYRVEVRGNPIPNVPFVRSELFPVKASDSDGLQNAVFKDMESGWNYRIVVRAIYGNDEEGEWSTPRLITTDGPRPPRFVDIVDIKATTATVTWTSGYGESDSKPANLQYKITLYQLIGTSETKLVTSHMARDGETQHTFVGKTKANMRYKAVIVTHASSTSPRESTPKEKSFRSNSERPVAPALGNIKVVNNEATIFWTRVPGRGDIKYYDVHLQQLGTGRAPNVEQYKTDTGLEDSYTFENLVKGYFYEFKVRGVVSNDEIGKWLIQTFYIPEGEIKKVTDPVVVKKSAHSITLTWNAGTRPDLKLYEIELVSERRGITEKVRTEGLSNSFKLEDLHPSTTYKYKIRAVSANENEKGPWSETLQFTTGEASILGDGTSTGTIVGIVLAIIAIVILLVVVVMIYRKRRGGPSFEKFDSSVKFQKNGAEGGLPAQEMDDTATAIRNGKKLYI